MRVLCDRALLIRSLWPALALGLALAGCQSGQTPAATATPRTVAAAPASSAADAPAAGSGSARDLPAGSTVPTPAPVAATATPTAGRTATLTSTQAPTATPAPTATAAPTATPLPTPTPTSTPAPKPALAQLTSGRCCWDPFWIGDQIAYIDKPSTESPAAVYAVPATGGEPAVFEARIGSFLNGGAFFSRYEGGSMIVERRSDGRRFTIPSRGQPVGISPDGRLVTWSIRQFEGAFDRRTSQLWVAELEGPGAPRAVVTLFGGGVSGWLPGDRWLLTGRFALDEEERGLFVYELATGQRRELFRALNFRSVSVSPDGEWVFLMVLADRNRERNGSWLLRTDGSEQRKLDWFGAFGWRDARQILYLPYDPAAVSHSVWSYDIALNSSRRITDPAVTPFKIAQGDFALSPDGRRLAFVSAADLNLWVLTLP